MTKKVLFGFASLFIVIGFVGVGIYFYLHLQQKQELLNNPSLSAEKVQQSILAKVGQLIELPTEAPTIATISDITKLQNQPFFQGAKNGEIVLLYPKTKEAILYNPVTNKIVKMGPINIATQQQPVAGASPSAAKSASSAATPTVIQPTPQTVKKK